MVIFLDPVQTWFPSEVSSGHCSKWPEHEIREVCVLVPALLTGYETWDKFLTCSRLQCFYCKMGQLTRWLWCFLWFILISWKSRCPWSSFVACAYMAHSSFTSLYLHSLLFLYRHISKSPQAANLPWNYLVLPTVSTLTQYLTYDRCSLVIEWHIAQNQWVLIDFCALDGRECK